MRADRNEVKINYSFHLWGFALNQVRALFAEYHR
jgi:hypothetical protein